MKGDPQAIAHLQAQLKNELTAINQYFVHYRMLKHWGLDKLAKKEYSESIGEMKHADWLMDRIFMLDGLPNLQDLAKLNVGEDVPEILQCDLKAEYGAQATIKAGIAHCESVRDYVSRDLLQKILDDTEEHVPVPEVAPLRDRIVAALGALARGEPADVSGLREMQESLDRAVPPDSRTLHARRVALLAAHLDPLVDSVDTLVHVSAEQAPD